MPLRRCMAASEQVGACGGTLCLFSLFRDQRRLNGFGCGPCPKVSPNNVIHQNSVVFAHYPSLVRGIRRTSDASEQPCSVSGEWGSAQGSPHALDGRLHGCVWLKRGLKWRSCAALEVDLDRRFRDELSRVVCMCRTSPMLSAKNGASNSCFASAHSRYAGSYISLSLSALLDTRPHLPESRLIHHEMARIW